ncbi:hypothetical protein ACFL09_05745 [Planctomycetota bacterium]
MKIIVLLLVLLFSVPAFAAYSGGGEGSMFAYEATLTTTIEAQGQYYAIQGFTVGSVVQGTTFKDGSNGVITDTASNGALLRVTDVGHGLDTGDYVTLNGMGDALHVASTRVTSISADVFDCDNINWNSDNDTGFWQRGSTLTVDTGFGGKYAVTWSVSCYSVGVNKNYKFEMVKNNTDLDEFASERKIAVASDLGSLGAGGEVSLVAGDKVWLQMQSTDSNSDLTIRHGNVHISRK